MVKGKGRTCWGIGSLSTCPPDCAQPAKDPGRARLLRSQARLCLGQPAVCGAGLAMQTAGALQCPGLKFLILLQLLLLRLTAAQRHQPNRSLSAPEAAGCDCNGAGFLLWA